MYFSYDEREQRIIISCISVMFLCSLIIIVTKAGSGELYIGVKR